jgi:hypothetical protein
MTKEILYGLITSASVSGICTFIIQAWIKSKFEKESASRKAKFEKELEIQKADLKAKADISLAELKHTFEVKNIKLTKVFDEQAAAIIGIYTNIRKVLNAADEYTKLTKDLSKEEKHEKLGRLGNEIDNFYDCYLPRKIYLPLRTVERTDSYLKSLQMLLIASRKADELLAEAPLITQDGGKKYYDLKTELDRLSTETPMLLLALEAEYRLLLGMSPDETKSQ